MLELAFWGIASLFTNYMMNYIYELFVKPKINRHIIIAIYTAILVSITYIISYFDLGMTFKWSFSFVLQLLPLLILYEGSIKQKIMAYIGNLVISMFSDVVVSEIAYGILKLNKTTATSYSYTRSILGIVCIVIQILAVYLISKMQRKVKLSHNLSKNQWKSIIVIIASHCAIAFTYTAMCYYTGIYMGHMFLIFILCSIVFCVYIFKIMVLMEVKNETEESISNMSKQNKMVMEYYEDISYKISNLSELRETYESKLKEVYEQAGKEYECKANVDEYRYRHIQCENTVVDNIITNVCIDLDRMKCDYDIDMNIPDNIKMEAMDLASIFINLFDNALSAIEGYVVEYGNDLPSNVMPSNDLPSNDMPSNDLQDKNDLSGKSDLSDKSNQSGRIKKCHLTAYADYGNNELTIEVKNVKSKSAKVRRMNDIFITTKENKEAHGYGMQIIKRIAKKYNGTMKVEYDETSFANKVTLKC